MSPIPLQLESTRLDRWLFAVRLAKSRNFAAKAVTAGKIKVNGTTAKAHRLVRVGDRVQLKRDGRLMEYHIKGVIDRRVGAKDAAMMYELTVDADLSPEMRKKVALYRELGQAVPKTQGRPTKKDRRLISKYKDQWS